MAGPEEPFSFEGIPRDQQAAFIWRIVRGLGGPMPSADAEHMSVPQELPGQRLIAEARLQASNDTNPSTRLHSFLALIDEGEHDLAPLAIAAWQQQPVADSEAATIALDDGVQLVETLADHKLFQDARRANRLLAARDPIAYMKNLGYFVRQGYTDVDNRLLHIDYSKVLDKVRTRNSSPPEFVTMYIESLAAYGVDLLDTETSGGKLFAACLEATTDPIEREWQRESVATEYAMAGHVEKALALKDLITDPFSRAITCMRMADVASKLDKEVEDRLISEARDLMPFVANCTGSCNRSDCNPQADIEAIEKDMALVFARRGDTEQAYQLLRPRERNGGPEGGQVYVELYKHNGDMTARAAAIKRVTQVAFVAPKVTRRVIEEISAADLRWGNTADSLEGTGEIVPLLYWELTGHYHIKSQAERRIEEGLSPEDHFILEEFGTDAAGILDELAEHRRAQRDQALCALVRVLASSGAFVTAKNLAEGIASPVEQVRAKAALGHIMRSASAGSDEVL